MVVLIAIEKVKSKRLARHLEKEHPSLKGKIFVNNKKLSKGGLNNMVVHNTMKKSNAKKMAKKFRKLGFSATVTDKKKGFGVSVTRNKKKKKKR